MTTDEINNYRFFDFSIMDINNQKVLILLCENTQMADNLYSLLSDGDYKLTVGVDKKHEYRFEIDFIKLSFKLQYKTNLTADKYPPLKWLANQSVSFVTTGLKGEGQQRYWNDKFLKLARPHLN